VGSAASCLNLHKEAQHLYWRNIAEKGKSVEAMCRIKTFAWGLLGRYRKISETSTAGFPTVERAPAAYMPGSAFGYTRETREAFFLVLKKGVGRVFRAEASAWDDKVTQIRVSQTRFKNRCPPQNRKKRPRPSIGGGFQKNDRQRGRFRQKGESSELLREPRYRR